MKRILITGANRGVGLELARQCAARGDQVFAGCRSPENTASLKEISTQYPGQVTILPLEITDEESIGQCAALVKAKTDALDILINNAATSEHGETVRTFRAEQALKQLHVNAVGQILVVQGFLALMQAAESPQIINVTSEAGSIATMDHFRGYYYYGSKAAINMYTRCLAWDPEMEGGIVIAMHPGWVRTRMGGPDAHLSAAESAEGILKVIASLTPADNGKFYTWEGNEYPW
jgi:NAD(P)-dependent dehydrogenase (short-subunit alcohol dehydrogenase family)